MEGGGPEEVARAGATAPADATAAQRARFACSAGLAIKNIGHLNVSGL